MITPLSFEAIEANLSMTMLDRFARCRRKWMYRYKYGLVPKTLPQYIPIGSASHAAIANFYQTWRVNKRPPHEPLLAFSMGLAEWYSKNPRFPHEQCSLILDIATYWWQNEGSAIENDYSEIVSVEEPLPLYIAYEPFGSTEPRVIPMRCTPDLVARRKDTGRLVLVDHKTVGRIGEAMDFLPIDFQLRSYAAAVYRRYGEAPELDYNLIRRELPPDFVRSDGFRPYGLTRTGRPSTRTADPKDYVQRVRQVFTPKQIESFENELSHLVTDVAQAWGRQSFPRSIIKAGGSACGMCEYLSACTRELDGEQLDGVTLSLTYNKEPLELPQPVETA